MSFRLLILSSLYIEYLKKYRRSNLSLSTKPYKEQYDKLLDNTSEPVGSYTQMFNNLGTEAVCIIENADFLQEKWAQENNIKFKGNKQLVFDQIRSYNPDVLWIENISYSEIGWIDYIRSALPSVRLIIASHCAPFNPGIIERFKNLDFIITCTPGLKKDFENNGLRAYCVYHAFNPEVLNKINGENPFEINDFIFSGSLFMGSGYHGKRLELIEKILTENIGLKIYGNLERHYKIKAKQFLYYIYRLLDNFNSGRFFKRIPLLNKYEDYKNSPVSNYSELLRASTNPPIFGMDMFKLLRNAKITLNIHGEVAGDYAGNMRLFEATGVGSCLLTDNKTNMNDLFICGEEVVVYNSFEECIEKAKWLLENEKERNQIAKAGQERTLKTHNVEARCRLLIDIISKELLKR
jgi:spore maturation protein CgeB